MRQIFTYYRHWTQYSLTNTKPKQCSYSINIHISTKHDVPGLNGTTGDSERHAPKQETKRTLNKKESNIHYLFKVRETSYLFFL